MKTKYAFIWGEPENIDMKRNRTDFVLWVYWPMFSLSINQDYFEWKTACIIIRCISYVYANSCKCKEMGSKILYLWATKRQHCRIKLSINILLIPMIRNQWWRSNDVLYNVVSFNRHRILPYQKFRPTNINSNCRTTNLFPSKP